jgi:head-tail adaptor
VTTTTGKRRDLLTFQRSVLTPNGSNELEETWQTHCQAYGEVKVMTGSEHSLNDAQQNIAEAVYTVEVLANAATTAITPRMRFTWLRWGRPVTLSISSALMSSDPEYVKILAQERL